MNEINKLYAELLRIRTKYALRAARVAIMQGDIETAKLLLATIGSK